jgi:putative endonuclease
MEDYFVYILYAAQYDKYYIGQTNDLDKRIWQHNNLDINSFTSKYRPWEIVAKIHFKSRESAMKAERFIKKQKSRNFIQKIILRQNDIDFISQIFPDC